MRNELEFLRDQAAKCRRLAESVSDASASRALRDLARDYDARAQAIEEASNPVKISKVRN